ncbi:unnamed protein product [Ambrosiozyma monospora]|uniref:Unnamed protein product n=1 Tax=Ambrosiozyma monospora TaxID=43982 RepID=A0ACB5SV03_AMBMO|nr:unnamed protein product [Ambrosiozyma monospora]
MQASLSTSKNFEFWSKFSNFVNISIDQLSPIIMAYTNTQITTASFHSISKQCNQFKTNELLIIPSTTTKTNDEWLHCWSIVAKHQHKFPGSLEYLHLYLLGNLQKQLSTTPTHTCILCRSSDETLDHLIEQ